MIRTGISLGLPVSVRRYGTSLPDCQTSTHNIKQLAASAIAPLILAAFLFLVARYYVPFSTALLLSVVISAYIFFWLSFLFTWLIGTRLVLTDRRLSVLVNASVAFMLSILGSVITGALMHDFSWIRMIRDSLTLATVCGAAYFLYLALRPAARRNSARL
jgi:hypothetical protein